MNHAPSRESNKALTMLGMPLSFSKTHVNSFKMVLDSQAELRTLLFIHLKVKKLFSEKNFYSGHETICI